MTLTRKERVLQAVRQNTLQLISENKLENSGVDATSLSGLLQLDRANVSKELNRLWHEGRLVKIQGKPILFLDYNELTSAFPDRFIPLTISNSDSLRNYTGNATPSDSLPSMSTAYFDTTSIIGANGSLHFQISTAKAAISYPPHGLHMLLIGNPGVGKIEFVNYIFDYAVKNSYKPSDAKLFIINCQNFADSRQLLAQQLFGLSKSVSRSNKASRGLIEQSNGGIIYFDGIHLLLPQTLDIILRAIEKGAYSRIGEITPRPLNATFIASFPENQTPEMTELLQHHMPVIIKLPDVDKTSTYEKIQIILDAFSREAQSLKRNIRIHKDILLCFVIMHYPENRTQIINVIKVACSNALMHAVSRSSDTVTIGYQHLSEKMLGFTENYLSDKQKAIEILSILPNDYIIFHSSGTTPAVNYIKNPPRSYSKVFAPSFMNIFHSNIDTIDEMEEYVQELIFYLMSCENSQVGTIRKMISPHLLQMMAQLLVQNRHYEKLLKKRRILLGLLLHLDEIIKGAKAAPRVQSENNHGNGGSITAVETILTALENDYSVKFTEKECSFINTYFLTAERIINRARVAFMVICHGDSTATDIIKSYRQLVDSEIEITGINFSPGMDINLLLESAEAKAKEINEGAGIAVMVDMEPLLSVSDYLVQKTGIEARTFAPVTLQGLIKTAQKAMEGASLHELTALSSTEHIKNTRKAQPQHSDFINRFVNEVIIDSLSFINPQKAVDGLIASLNNILKEQNIPFSNEIAVKFLSHAVHMLERTIRNDALSHPKLKQFINENYRLMSVVEKHLTTVANTFGIRIPAGEIAYVTEIFKEYIG